MGKVDYSRLADSYGTSRPDYSVTVLRALLGCVRSGTDDFVAADVGAGTGIWTRMVAEQGVSCLAIEPNAAMRSKGIEWCRSSDVRWVAGSAEETGLESHSVDWVTMASSFHWARTEPALREFSRILRKGRCLTILWNPRELADGSIHKDVELMIGAMVPGLKRVSSGSNSSGRDYESELRSTGDFGDVIFMEARHDVRMSRERYMQAWRSVYDIQEQAGPDVFAEILQRIGRMVAPMEFIDCGYRTRAWTATKLRDE